MSALRLYWSPDSANLVIRQALELFELPFEAVRIDRGRLEHKSEAYLVKNPQGLLPVLEDGELVLFETGAILLHLADRVGRLGPTGPGYDEPGPRAAFQKWLFYLSNTPHAELRAAFYTHRYVGDEAAIPQVWTGLARRLRGHLDLIEGQLPEEGGMLGPVTLVDTYLGCLIRWSQLYGGSAHRLAGIEEWPKLYRLMRQIEVLPAIQRAFAAEHIPLERPLTGPERPQLPEAELTGH